MIIDLSYLDEIKYINDSDKSKKEKIKEFKDLFIKNQKIIDNLKTSKERRNKLIKQNKYILDYCLEEK